MSINCVEPASSVSIAGLFKLSKMGYLEKGKIAVCILTGHGLKDPNVAIKSIKIKKAIPPKAEKVIELLGF